ncbi:hypothetical protein ACQEVF_57430 [Nonomuraea polychroma]|uniref:hypothetical protein n=1 Tax=Nonomuraea polychroma TaxID=46176 RepID=UPI003D8BBCAC
MTFEEGAYAFAEFGESDSVASAGDAFLETPGGGLVGFPRAELLFSCCDGWGNVSGGVPSVSARVVEVDHVGESGELRICG